jgi:hypothetical protein
VKDHSVLSFGYTRALWDGGNAEDVQRMKGYAEQLASYVVVTNSNKRHRLQPLRLAQNFEAIRPAPFTPPTASWTSWRARTTRLPAAPAGFAAIQS